MEHISRQNDDLQHRVHASVRSGNGGWVEVENGGCEELHVERVKICVEGEKGEKGEGVWSIWACLGVLGHVEHAGH